MFFSCKRGEFDRYFNRLDRPVEESRPDRQPDRFPSLFHTTQVIFTFSIYLFHFIAGRKKIS